jgi:hypothetical protein
VRELRGPALAIAAVIVTFCSFLATVIVVGGWTGLSVYALVKIIGGGSDDPDVAGILIALVLFVTVLVALLAGGIKLVGKAMEPAKPRDRDEAVGF